MISRPKSRKNIWNFVLSIFRRFSWFWLWNHWKGLKRRKKIKSGWKKCFDQLLGACSICKLVKIHNKPPSNYFFFNLPNWKGSKQKVTSDLFLQPLFHRGLEMTYFFPITFSLILLLIPIPCWTNVIAFICRNIFGFESHCKKAIEHFFLLVSHLGLSQQIDDTAEGL